jgi:hypothetical protein
MNDLDNDPEGSPAASEPQAVEEIRTIPDAVLGAMVEAVSRSDAAELGLTLYVSGTVISGILVSGKRFFELMADWLTAQGAQEFAENFARPTAELFSRPDTESADEGEAEVSFSDYIHLRAARVFTSGNDRPLPETFWRGRLSHVSGWSFGTMRASEA